MSRVYVSRRIGFCCVPANFLCNNVFFFFLLLLSTIFRSVLVERVFRLCFVVTLVANYNLHELRISIILRFYLLNVFMLLYNKACVTFLSNYRVPCFLSISEYYNEYFVLRVSDIFAYYMHSMYFCILRAFCAFLHI